MGDTLHEQLARSSWDRHSIDYAIHSSVVKHKGRWLENHDAMDDVIGQYFRSDFVDMPQFYALAQIRALLFSGEGHMSFCHINIGCEPHADKDLEYHQNVLSNLHLTSIDGTHDIALAAEVWNGPGGGSDGFIEIVSPVKFEVFGQPDKIHNPKWQFPLEIGYTTASRSLLHLLEEGGLARWPYGSSVLTLISLDDDKVFALPEF